MISSVRRRVILESRRPYSAQSLGYSYDALEPYIDSETMKVHYSKHYVGYLEKLNKAMTGVPTKNKKTVQALLENFGTLPKTLSDTRKETIRFNAGGVDNHNIFWTNIKPGGAVRPNGELLSAINASYGREKKFKERFADQAMDHRGSGWCWLVKKSGGLGIETTDNQDSPRLRGWAPLLGLDIWEHAYYLKYKSDRKKYIENFWKIVNWSDVSARLAEI